MKQNKFIFTTLGLALAFSIQSLATAQAQAVTPDPTTDLCTYKIVNGVPDPTTLQCGDGAEALGPDSVAIGPNSYAGSNSVTVGKSSSATGNSVAIGNNINAGNSTIVGNSNNGINANIVGTNNNVSGMGVGSAPAQGINSVGNNVSITNAITSWTPAFYYDNSNLGSDVYIRGYNNTNSGSGAFIKGSENTSSGTAIAISGTKNTVLGATAETGFTKAGVESGTTGATIVGYGAKGYENCNDGVAIGSGSDCNESDIVSFGSDTKKRRLTNLRNGYAGSDAATIDQLSQVAGGLGGGASYFNGLFIAPTYNFRSGASYNDVGSALDDLDGRVYNLENNPGSGSGTPGPAGVNGLSAYEIAINNGYSGTEQQWLESLKVKGDKGDTGATGPAGANGTNGIDGKDGTNGVDGKDGATGPAGANGTNGVDGKDGTNGVDGKDGATGPSGADGTDGKDGEQGPAGKDGVDGSTGPKGDKGDKGDTGTNGSTGDDELAVRYDSSDKSTATLRSSSGGNTRLSGVANGRIEQGSTDAVNGGQIWEMNDSWERRFKETNSNIEKMGAQSAALTMMAGANSYLPVGKVAVGAGVGFYGKEAAMAVGAKVRSSEKTSWSLGFSFSDGKAMGGVGFSVILD